MSDGNPLVADRVDTTSAFAGAFLLQDGEDLANAISSGDWAAGALAVTSTALDTVGAIIDPIGTLIANGLGWVLDHIEPLKSWFNDFTGDAAEVASFSGTWGNTSGYIAQLADTYQGTLSQLDDMAGEGIDAYVGYANAVIANLRAAGEWSNAIAVGLQIASTLVQAVHDIVRDVLSQLVGSAISAAATTAATIGFGAPVAMAQFGTKVAALVAKVSRVITKVLDALTQLLRRLEPLIRNIGEVYRKFIAFIKRAAEALHLSKADADVPGTDLPIAGGKKPDGDDLTAGNDRAPDGNDLNPKSDHGADDHDSNTNTDPEPNGPSPKDQARIDRLEHIRDARNPDDSYVYGDGRRNWARGEIFNLENHHRYDINELHVTKPDSPHYNRIDSFNPGNELVSRKETQLAEVSQRTARGYLDELVNKYGINKEDVTIANTPSNRRDLIAAGHNPDDYIGKPLQGQQVLEVPEQKAPPPPALLQMAADRQVEIRDIAGTVWELSPDGSTILEIRADGSTISHPG
ncbi:hypothetical protein [Microbacterium gorillae]|uniref:hypothetical protein n=1 Tax=Microbacterium gorillae TaxID=1231063 RepID=UPI003D998EBF